MKISNIFLTIVAALFFSCTDLDSIEDRLDILENKTGAIEQSLSQLEQAVKDQKTISSITKITSGSGGWIVKFTDGETINILNGEEGLSPSLQVDSDGYWIISYDEGKTFTRIHDSNGNPVKAVGKDGKNGIDGKNGLSPSLQVDSNGYWIISYDEGKTFTRIHDSNGNPIKAVGKDGGNGNDGEDGLTPFIQVDSDGYWCVSYDEGKSFTRIQDSNGNPVKASGKDGNNGENGKSLRVTTDADGMYQFEIYDPANPGATLEVIMTPLSSNSQNAIKSITEDLLSHLITLEMQDGTSYTFSKSYVLPTGIILLDTKGIVLSKGTEAQVTFRVNPSTASFIYDVESEDCQIFLDNVSQTKASYVTTPSNYQLVKVEAALNDKKQVMKGQYVATIKDLEQSEAYDEVAALTLRLPDGNDGQVEYSSEVFSVQFSDHIITGFSLLLENNTKSLAGDIIMDIEEDVISKLSPMVLNASSLVATFTTCAKEVLLDGTPISSGETEIDLSTFRKLEAVGKNGEKTEYILSLSTTGLPVVVVGTPDKQAVTSKEDWIEGANMTIYNPDGSVDFDGTTQIKGRGNTTWKYPKKPYALKLDNKSKILGMKKNKRWCLLANYVDRTLLRNDIAFEIAHRTGMDWNPSGQFVELIFNGKHAGTYYLCEQIKVDENRVNIAELDPEITEGEGITGGFIMELDTHYDELFKFKSAIKNLPFMFKDPDEVNNAQFSYMKDYINDFEDMLYTEERFKTGEFKNYMDMDSFIDWWFINELAVNREPKKPKSVYMHKDQGGVLKAGPVWDYDYGTFTSNKSQILMGALYYDALFKDSEFKARVKELWKERKSGFEEIPSYIDAQAAKVKVSCEINYQMWPPTLNVNKDESLSFDDAVNKIKTYYLIRIKAMDKTINAL